MEKNSVLKRLASCVNKEQFITLHESMSFENYVERVQENPDLARTAYQRIYDMIMSKGFYEFERHRRKLTHYNFFDEEIPIFGLERTIDSLVKFVRGAAGGFGTEKRVLLLHGPVGSSKSTIARRIKRGLEEYSKTPEGALYTFKWVDLPASVYLHKEDLCPMHEDPLKLIDAEHRREFLLDLNAIRKSTAPEEKRSTLYDLQCEGDLCPRCRKFMGELRTMYHGDWEEVVSKHISVVRMVMSESDRVGIATFQPKDEKNQDATELTGDVDFSKLPHYGNDADPRAFGFNGEFCAANRGFIEFIEMLKLAPEFLYDLLGASQERRIKPKKFAQVSVDEMILGHTNSREYQDLKADDHMEALCDRTVVIDVPYLTKLSDEIKVLEQDYGPGKVKQHVAPHTLEVAALFGVLTRLEEDKEGKVDLVKKAKLYNGEAISQFNEDAIKELQDRHPDEGMSKGISVRYTQDKISNCLSDNHDYINPFMVMNEIREGLDSHSLIKNKDDLAHYHACAEMTIRELDEILKDEVREALTGDKKALERLCANYVDNVMAYIRKSKVKNPYTKRDEAPNERLMRSIEEQISVTELQSTDFRRMIAAFIGDLANSDKKFHWDSNPELKAALQAKLYEDTRDHIKISALHVSGAATVDPDLQEKIDAVKKRLIDQHGYNDKSASDVLDYVGSLFSQSNMKERD